nr:L,D-transpeptidase [Phreatobacter stygius]
MQAEPGTIIIRNSERRLYLVQGDGTAIRYTVAVGMASKQWEGVTVINGRHVRPAWAPPAVVKRDRPSIPDLIPGGAPNNPMGEAAMTLAGGEYAIHGTNAPNSVGRAASYGCFRMLNADVVDLMSRVSVGTRVVVTR